MIGLVGMIAIMRTPEWTIQKLRNGMIWIGTKEVETEKFTAYSWFSFASEFTNRLISVVLRLIFAVIGGLIFFSTFSDLSLIHI